MLMAQVLLLVGAGAGNSRIDFLHTCANHNKNLVTDLTDQGGSPV